ncbi:MAG: hypothetical protein ACRDTA_24325 [Pseudonocardiaceae bacterium]
MADPAGTAPSAVADLDELAQHHQHVDPLIAAAANSMRPLAQRGEVLAKLHQAINAHLDDEEGSRCR